MMNGVPTARRRPIYRSRSVLAAPVLLYFVVEAWLALNIVGRGCPGTITSADLVPVVITLGTGVLGASLLLVVGAIRRRRDVLVLAASLGVAVIIGLLAFKGAYSAFYCM